jgi:hypothetical protein
MIRESTDLLSMYYDLACDLARRAESDLQLLVAERLNLAKLHHAIVVLDMMCAIDEVLASVTTSGVSVKARGALVRVPTEFRQHLEQCGEFALAAIAERLGPAAADTLRASFAVLH